MGDNVNDGLDNKNPVVHASVDTKDLSAEQSDSFDDAKKEADKAQAETKESSETLQGSVVDSATAKQEAKSDSYVTQQEITNESNLNNYEKFMEYLTLNSPIGFEKAIDTLLDKIQNVLKDARKKRGLSKSGKETLNNVLGKLKKYKDILNDKKKLYKKGANKEVYAHDIDNLKKIRQNVEKAKYDISKGQRGELSNTAGYNYNSPENAKSSNRAQEHMLEFEQKLQQEVNDGAILNIFNKQTHTATNFYRRIAEGQYTSADYTIYINNSNVLTPSFQRCGIQTPTEQGIVNPATGRRTGRYIDYGSMDWETTFKQGGIAGVIDKGLSHCNNLTPGQRETWKSLGVLAGFGAGIYGLYKFFTSKKSFWAKAGITAGAFLGTQILTGENPISLFSKFMTGGLSRDKIKNSFGNAVSGVRDSGIEASETITPAMFSLMVFDQGTTIGNINEMTQSFKADNKEWSRFYQESINKLTQQGGAQCAEYFRATFSDGFDEQKRNNWLASFGVVDISNPSNSGIFIYELANNATMNEVILEKFKSENGLKETDDKTKKQEFKQYKNSLKTNNQVLSIAVLQQHKNDWFDVNNDATYSERREDKENRTKLVNSVNNLPIDEVKKDELKTAIQTFYDERTIASKPNPNDFDLKMENGLLILRSNGSHECKIKLDTKEIEGFGPGITFTKLADLLNTADLANKILETQKGKISKDKPPFQYKLERKGICFNDATGLRQDLVNRNKPGMDTRVLSTGRWGATSKIDTLYEHPSEFAKYLSDRREVENKIDVDSTQYPIVTSLSKTGIIFTNEQEIKDLEIWLKGIKEKLQGAEPTPNENPFSITLTNKLEFKAVNNDIVSFDENISTKFPTLSRQGHKEKFLSYMNNEDNEMRGKIHK